ncbi:MAG: hypothetical protein NT051_06990 [Candidatus Micrarchaeota archaeon]|nr:hypothetical protein [Candidatus Micrarchaeota archaeon]
MGFPSFLFLNRKFQENVSRNVWGDYDDYTVPKVKVRAPLGSKLDSAIAKFSFTERDTGISLRQLSALKRQFRLLEKGKKNEYGAACEKIASTVAGHLNLQFSQQHIELAKLDIMKSSKEILREASRNARANRKNFITGVAISLIGAAISFAVARASGKGAAEIAGYTIIAGITGFAAGFIGAQRSSDSVLDPTEYHVRLSYNACAAVMDACQ